MKLKSLWIMRHGLAENEFDSDFNRALSSYGYQQAANIAEQLIADNADIENMIVSPFKRTQETATCVHNKLGLTKAFKTDDLLVHFADHQLLGDYLLAFDKPSVMIVSHMPIVANLTQYLVPNCEIFGYQTAQTVKVSFDSLGHSKIEKVYLPNV